MSHTRSSSPNAHSSSEDACLCLCGLKLKPEEREKCPDHLKNWELWMKRRKEMHVKLAKKRHCLPGDLLMNSGDEYRSIVEEREVLEYRKINTNFDKYRGNPDFWKLPVALRNREPPFKGSEYFAVKSRPERNEIPEVTHVGVPSRILEEKDVLPRTRCLKTVWTESKYRQQTVQLAGEKLQQIVPHQPDLNLMIIGSNQASEEDKQPVEGLESPGESMTPPQVPLSRIRLRINGKEVDEFTSEDREISLIFEHLVGDKVPAERCVSLENSGQVALRIKWRPYEKLKIFREFTEKTYIFHPFTFDKRELLLPPGMRHELPIWFRMNHPGNHFEYWEIHTVPRIWSENLRFTILLKGFAFIRDLDLHMDALTERLRQRVRDTCVKDVLNAAITKANYCNPTTTPLYSFSERELFESANLQETICKQSAHYVFNSEVVEELKEFYREVRLQEDPLEWDLSIGKLVEMSRKRDLLRYFENRLELYRRAKEGRKMLQEAPDVKTRSKDQGPKSKRPKDTDKAATLESSDHLQSPSSHGKLCKLLQKLEKPSIYTNKERKKYLYCFTVLKTYLMQAFDKLADLDEPLANTPNCINKRLKQPQLPDRLVFELFEESYILRTKRISRAEGSSNAKPRSVLVKGIVSSDAKKMFKAYFSKEETAKKPGTAKSEVSDAKKSQKSQKSVKQSRQDVDLYAYVDPNYDPFFQDPQVPEEAASTSSTSSAIIATAPKSISQEKYLMVYVALGAAVDALVETIESFKETSISTDYLGELGKCLAIPQKSVENLQEQTRAAEVILQPTESQLDYLDFLQQTHQNQNIQKYFIEERRAPNVGLPKILQLEETEAPLENVFSLQEFLPKLEPYCLKNAAAQTELLQGNSTVLEEEKLSTSSKQSSSSIQSRNMFYFLDTDSQGHTDSWKC